MKKFIAANWKMYKTSSEASEMLKELLQLLPDAMSETEVAVFPPFTAIAAVDKEIRGHEGLYLGAQDVYPATEGAFTGEISPVMLLDAGCRYVLVGHSERRHILGENNELVAQKTSFSLEQGLRVVLCVGETLEQRESGELSDILYSQLQTALKDIPAAALPSDAVTVAYEPVWAIGTGKVAGLSEIEDVHAMIRKFLKDILPNQNEGIRILYGGSVKPDNAADIKRLDNVDGLLVGGASLKAESFNRIIQA